MNKLHSSNSITNNTKFICKNPEAIPNTVSNNKVETKKVISETTTALNEIKETIKPFKEHNGNLDFKEYQALDYIPSPLNGHLDLGASESLPEGFIFPKIINGSLHIRNVKNLPEGCKFPETIAESLYIWKVEKFPNDFTLPKEIGGFIVLQNLSKDEVNKLKNLYNLKSTYPKWKYKFEGKK